MPWWLSVKTPHWSFHGVEANPADREASFWVVNLFSQRFDPVMDEERRFAVRSVAYALLDGPPTVLCGLPDLAGVPVVVITADGDVSRTLDEACPRDGIGVSRR